MVNKCGAHSVSEDDICNAIRLCNRPGIISRNRYRKKTYYCVGDHTGMTPIDTPFLRKSYRSIIDYYSRVDSCTLVLKVVQNEYKQPICHDLPEDTIVDTLDVSIKE